MGSGKDNCVGRCFHHINCANDTGNNNLRLAYPRRSHMKEFLRLIFIPCGVNDDEKEIEKNIRNEYLSFFGQ